MKKGVTIGIVVALVIAIGVAAAISYGGGSKGNNNPSTIASLQNTTTGISQTVNNATTAVSVQNTTGRHFDVTLQEQVGIKQK